MKKRNGKVRLIALLMAMILVLTGITPVAAADGVQINKDSVTITTGSTYQLKVTVNGAAATANWGSSDTSVATVSQTGLVTGKAKGSAVITAMVNGTSIECIVSVVKATGNETTRYNVLILDASGSMKGKPDTAQKTAAKRFCSKVLSTNGKNYVAIVSMNSSAKTVCKFTNNYNNLAGYINSVVCGGDTNFEKALATAGSLLDNTSINGSNVIKNIILCSDGLPTTGKSVSSGRYVSADYRDYAYANAAYNTADVLKKKNYFIYALGFFHSSTGNNLKFGKRLMKDLASKDKYYIIQDANDLDDVFDDIADKITKTTMSKTSITIKYGQTYQLNALVNGVKKTAKWSSADTKIATVSASGLVKGKSAGTTTIKATVNGKSVTCKVTVKPTITLNKTSCTLSVGEKVPLKATVKGTKSKVTWKSSSSSVASVDSSGVVKAKKAGKTVITASVGGVSVKCTVTVKKATHPLYSVFFNFKQQKYGSSYSWKYIDEEGMRIVLNDEAVIEKCGAYAEKKGSYWYVTLAFKGKNIKSPTVSSYVGYKGKIVYDAMTYSQLNKFSTAKDSNGIWSIYGKFQDIRFNVTDINGNIVTNLMTGKQGVNTKHFTDLKKMKDWLAK